MIQRNESGNLVSDRMIWHGVHVGYTVTESEIEQEFFGSLNQYLSGATLVVRGDITGCDPRGIPDGWVMYRGMMCPVEVKQRTFGAWALDQLLGYLRAYRCRHGVAVAERFTWKARSHHRVTCVTIPVDRSRETARTITGNVK